MINTEWVKSTYSGGEGGNCVEWSPSYAATHDTVPVRDSKTPTAPTLMLTPAAWTGFLAFATNAPHPSH
ncbi:DUF397 domain-containing protein [Streptomyces sp. NPDC058391]|uniref:DUF397 domain-containing protein n=1 Tax=unclassified Streptomyces TaxID=2593676 RepID=UPI00366062EA